MITLFLTAILSNDLDITSHVVISSPVTYQTITVRDGGHLEILPGAEITFEDAPLDTTNDPDQLSHGLIVYGKLAVKGTPKTAYVRVGGDLLAGTAFVPMATPKDWQPGDRVFIPDTRQPDHPFNPAGKDIQDPLRKKLQHEFLTIRQATASGILLDAPLAYSHLGCRDADGKPVLYPVIANLTRDVVFRSSNPNGVRAHAFFTMQADVDIQNAAFLDMGRTTGAPIDDTKKDAKGSVLKIGTNQRGRYPIHFHHYMGPPTNPLHRWQFTCSGNVVYSTVPIGRWGITVHQSHYGLVSNNVIVSCAGGGIVTEDGNETGNRFENNYVADVTGEGRPDARTNEVAFEGSAFWFRGGNNSVSGNHVYGCKDGYIYYPRFASTSFKYPSVPGGMLDTSIDPCKVPIPQFTDNECVSCQIGFSSWFLGFIFQTPVDGIGPSNIDRLKCWHVRSCVSAYEGGRFLYNDLLCIGDKKLSNDNSGGWGSSDYPQWRCEVNGGRIENYNSGIRTPAIADRLDASGTNPGLFVIQGTRIRCRTNITVPTPWHNANAKGLPPVTVHIDNVNMQPLDKTTKNIAYALSPSTFMNYVSWVSVNVHHGPIHLRWFGPQQVPDFVLKATSPDGRIQGAPMESKNSDAWQIYGLASAGEISPDGIKTPENDGCCVFTKAEPYICAIPDMVLQPGQSWTYGIRAYDPSLGALEYHVKGPDGMAIENRSGKINWTAIEGVHQVTVEAVDVDSGVRGSRTFTISVRMPPG